MKGALLKFVLIVLILTISFSLSRAIYAEETIEMNASVDADKIGMQDNLILRISVSGRDLTDVPPPTPGELKDFTTIGTSRSTSTHFQLIGDQQDVKITYTYVYVLKPLKKGTIAIPPATIKYKGKIYSTDEISIEVVEGSIKKVQPQRRSVFDSPFDDDSDPFSVFRRDTETRPVTDEDLFIEQEPSKNEIYVGEQVVLNTYLYTTVPVSALQQISGANTFDGFWVEDVKVDPNMNATTFVKNNRRYTRYLVKQQVLFPRKQGTYKIPGANYGMIARGRGFSLLGDNQRIERSTKPLSIHVKTLPESGRPDNFSGITGKISIKAQLDKQKAAVGEAVNLTVTYSGEGNLKELQPPQLDKMQGFTMYKPELEEYYSFRDDKWIGEKNWKFILVPKFAGKEKIEPFEIVYFDPILKDYITRKTKPLNLEILEGSASDQQFATRREPITGKTDINYIKSPERELADESKLLLQKPTGWALILLPAFMNLALFAYNFVQSRRKVNVSKFRFKNAQSSASRSIKAASKAIKDNRQEEFYNLIIKSMANYFADKLDIAPGGLTIDQIRRNLKDIDANLTGRVIKFLEDCEYYQFSGSRSPGPEKMKEILNEARDLINNLEKVIKRK